MIGLLAAVALSSVIGSLRFGVSATDPLTYAAVAGALLTVATAASWLPAERAAAVPPSTAFATSTRSARFTATEIAGNS